MESLTKSPYGSYQGGYFQTLIAPDQSGNTLALLELTLPKGAEPPRHVHTLEDEAFYILDGEISVTVADKLTVLKAGEALFAPRNMPHSFKILTEKATIINVITPGTLWNYFMECSEPISQKPQTVAPVALSPEKVKAMLDRISNVYKVNFL